MRVLPSGRHGLSSELFLLLSKQLSPYCSVTFVNTVQLHLHKFEKFQETCGKAYMALRNHTSLLTAFFTIMLPKGITDCITPMMLATSGT